MGNTQKLDLRTRVRTIVGVAAVVVLSGIATVTATPAESAHADTGNVKSGVGFYVPSNSSFHLSYEAPPSSTGESDRAFKFGPANNGEIAPVAGDWDGDGATSVGFYRYSDASWHLGQELNDGSDLTFNFGPAGNTTVQPVVGDWNGDGKDTVGFYVPSNASWHLASSNSSSATSTAFVWGTPANANVRAVAGDWNADGKDTVGWYLQSNASWHLATANDDSASSLAFTNGPAGDTTVLPVTGDWDGNGGDSIGWYKPSNASYHLTNTNGNVTSSDINFNFGPTGNSAIVPVAGDWDGKAAPSSAVQAVAKRLVAQHDAGKLQFMDGREVTYQREILPYAETGTAPAGCRVDIRILQALAMTVDRFGSARVSDIGRPCIDLDINCDISLHCYDPAKALDVIAVGGVSIPNSEAQRIAYVDYLDSIVPNGSQAGQFNCMPNRPAFQNIRPVDDEKCNHQHFDLGSATGAVRYTS